MKRIAFNLILFVLLTIAFSSKAQIIDPKVENVFSFYSFIEECALYHVGTEFDPRDWEEFIELKGKKNHVYLTDVESKISVNIIVYSIVIDMDRDSLIEFNYLLDPIVESTGFALNKRAIKYEYINSRGLNCHIVLNYETRRITLIYPSIL